LVARERGIGVAVALFTTFAFILVACDAPPAAPVGNTPSAQGTSVPVDGGGSYTDVDAAGLATMLQNKDFPLVNVHIPYEGEIEGTDLFIPYDEIDRHLDQLPADKGARVVLYCRSDRMSGIAANTLVKLGYTDVWNLDGGMVAWQAAGYPIREQAAP
jgi:rhodanese-related sulfurtransferase